MQGTMKLVAIDVLQLGGDAVKAALDVIAREHPQLAADRASMAQLEAYVVASWLVMASRHTPDFVDQVEAAKRAIIAQLAAPTRGSA
jgi:hypothetical protein